MFFLHPSKFIVIIVHGYLWWPGRLGQQGGVVELEEPRRLSQQCRAIDPQDWWPGRLGQQDRHFNIHPWFKHVFHACHNTTQITAWVSPLYYLSYIPMVYPISLLVLKLGAGLLPLVSTRGYGCGCFLRSPLDAMLISTK